MNIFLVYFIAHIQAQIHLKDVTSGVEGKVVAESPHVQESVEDPVIVIDPIPEPAPQPDPIPVPEPIQKRPVYLGDPYCGVTLKKDKERWDACMQSSEREEFIKSLAK